MAVRTAMTVGEQLPSTLGPPVLQRIGRPT
jgi:hypothetical protein